MKIIKPQTLSLLTRPFEFQHDYWLGCAVVAFLPIGETHTLLPETAMWPFLAEELPPDQPLDAVIPKVRAEFLAIAHAFAPDGVAAPMVPTGIQLGASIKRLDVFGDREFDRNRGQITEPVPFTQMKMDWSRAYGGEGFADNPLGKGTAPTDPSDDRIFPVENVIDRGRRGEGVRSPAAYAPVDQMWPVRAKLVGTYDDAWKQQDFPGFARDIDWRFFNCASPDQWLADGLAGNETYAFENLHPTQPLLKGRLPGLAPRLFIVRKGQEEEGFEEIPLALTTVWCFPHRERLALVHHGKTRIAEEDASDIVRVLIGADRLDALRAADEFRAVMVKRLDRKSGAMDALRDADLVPAEWLRPDSALTGTESEAQRQIRARVRRRAEREHAAKREELQARGLDPDKFAPQTLPPERPPPTLDELPGFIAETEAEAATQKASAEAEVAANKARMAGQLAAAGVPEEEIQKRLNAKPKGPPAFSAAGFLAEQRQRMTAMRLAGIDTSGLEAQLASSEFIAQLERAEAMARNAYRLTAQHQDAADRLPAERSDEIRRLVSHDAKAARLLYDLHGADLSGLDLTGVDLSGVCLDGADLKGTSFAGANLADAVLAHADMTNCVFDKADLTGANLGHARLSGASLRGAVLKKSVLAGADLTGALLTGADLEAADLDQTILIDTDFTDVSAPNLLAMKLSLRGLRAPGIKLTKAKFIECDIEAADWRGASLEQAVFIECNLAGIQLGKASMRKSVFVRHCNLARADLSSADLTEANLRETSLPGASLADAIIERADFSAADLTSAVLTHARAAGSRWVAANLSGANLDGADFAQADMSRVDLRGAHLAGVSLYEANLARARLDRDTVRSGMLMTRMRYLPLHQPPESRPT